MKSVSVIVIINNLVDKIETFREKEVSKAEKCFYDRCNEYFPDFDKRNQEYKDAILEDGYEKFDNGSICLTWSE